MAVAHSSKRFRSFFLGILFASVTWSISLYLYWRLNQATLSYKTTRRPISSESHQAYQLKNDIFLPYEKDEKKLQRSMSKYFGKGEYKNSETLKEHLKPEKIKPLVDMDEGNLYFFIYFNFK